MTTALFKDLQLKLFQTHTFAVKMADVTLTFNVKTVLEMGSNHKRKRAGSRFICDIEWRRTHYLFSKWYVSFLRGFYSCRKAIYHVLWCYHYLECIFHSTHNVLCSLSCTSVRDSKYWYSSSGRTQYIDDVMTHLDQKQEYANALHWQEC